MNLISQWINKLWRESVNVKRLQCDRKSYWTQPACCPMMRKIYEHHVYRQGSQKRSIQNAHAGFVVRCLKGQSICIVAVRTCREVFLFFFYSFLFFSFLLLPWGLLVAFFLCWRHIAPAVEHFSQDCFVHREVACDQKERSACSVRQVFDGRMDDIRNFVCENKIDLKANNSNVIYESEAPVVML